MRKGLYDWMYRNNRAPWDIGPRKELVEAVESGRIQPCRAIDLGCGTASNAIFLAQRGFDVTGTDYSPAAIALCRQRGAAAGVTVQWIEDNLTDLQHVAGPFDFLVDWGVYDDLSPADRRAWPAFAVALVVFGLILNLLGLFDVVATTLARPATVMFGYLGLAFSLAIGVNIFFMVVVSFLEWLLSRLKGVSVLYNQAPEA